MRGRRHTVNKLPWRLRLRLPAPMSGLRWSGRMAAVWTVGCIALAALVAGADSAPASKPIIGRAMVTDGDSLRLSGLRIRPKRRRARNLNAELVWRGYAFD